MVGFSRGSHAAALGAAAAHVPLFAAALYIAIVLARYGVPLIDSMKYAGYLVAVILLPGRLMWRRLDDALSDADEQPRRLAIEAWVLGSSLGFAVELVSYSFFRWAGHPRLYICLPAAIVLVLGVREVRRRHLAVPTRLPTSTAVGLAVVVAFVVHYISSAVFSRYPLDDYRIRNVDEPFHLALVGELRHHVPPEYPYVDAGQLTYQWFLHAHHAAATWATGLESMVVYRRFEVLAMPIIAILGTAVMAMRITRRTWPGVLSAAVLGILGAFDVSGIYRGRSPLEGRFLEGEILLNSPTQAFAFAQAPALICLSLLLLTAAGSARRAVLAVSAVSMSLMAGTKVTFLPMFLCGFVAVVGLWLVRHRKLHSGALFGAVITAVVIAASGLLLYRGDSQSLSWAPGATAELVMSRLGIAAGATGVLVVTAGLLLGWLVPSAGAVGLVRHPSLRWDPSVWWLFAASFAGLGATFLLAHGGASQLYFGRSASLPLAVLCGWGMASLFPAGTPRGRYVLAGVAAVGAGILMLGVRGVTERLRTTSQDHLDETAVLGLWVNVPALLILILLLILVRLLMRDLTRGGRSIGLGVSVAFLLGLGLARPSAFIAGHTERIDPEAGHEVGEGGVEVARWIRAHSNPEDLVLTNAHCANVPDAVHAGGCDSRHFWMSALTERRFLIEGWAYTRHGDSTNDFWGEPALLERNDEVFRSASDRAVTRLLSEFPARWMLVDTRAPSDLNAIGRHPRFTVRFHEGDFAAVEIGS